MKISILLSSLFLTGIAWNANATTAAQANNAFAFDFFKQANKPNTNLFFSPISLRTAFAMAAEGASGKTRAQIDRVFHFPDSANGDLADAVLQKQFVALSAAKDFQFSVANGLWLEKNFVIQKSFRNALTTNFSSEIQTADFVHHANDEREKINRWVELKTQLKIHELFPKGSMNSLTRLVLANAVYFKGSWVNPFKKSATLDEEFHAANGEVIKTPTMHLAANFNYAEDAKAQYLRLPYKGDEISMVIALGKTNAANHDLSTPKISANDLSVALKSMRSRRVVVSLPRFKSEVSFDLAKTLPELGLTDAFSAKDADFSGIDGKHDLFIAAAFHKAFIAVDEQGAEAAAATGVSIGLLSVRSVTPTIFRADHPFLFFIVDDQTGAILFMGKLARP